MSPSFLVHWGYYSSWVWGARDSKAMFQRELKLILRQEYSLKKKQKEEEKDGEEEEEEKEEEEEVETFFPFPMPTQPTQPAQGFPLERGDSVG
jgi:hypothetical protein